jgi:hypothetical protein
MDIDVLTTSIKEFALAKIAQHMEKVEQNLVSPVSKSSQKYKEDTEYAEKVRTAARKRFHKLSKEEREQINKRSNERYKTDPEYREKKKQKAKERLAKLREERRAAKAAASKT